MIRLFAACCAVLPALGGIASLAQDARREPTYEEQSSAMSALKRCELVDLGAVFVAMENWPDIAVSLVELAADPADPSLHNQLGNQFARRALYEPARRAYECAVHLDKDYAAAWNNLGVLYLGQAAYGKAQGALKHATAVKPNYALAHYNLGVALDQAGEYDEALRSYGRAVTLDPRLAALRFNPQVATNDHQVPIFLGRLQEQHAALGGALDDSPPRR